MRMCFTVRYVHVVNIQHHQTRWRLDGPGSNPGGGEVFRTRPDRPWGPSSLLYSGCRVFSFFLKGLECGVYQLPPCSAEVKEIVELYLSAPYLDLYGLF